MIRTVVEGHEALVGDLELERVEEGGGVVQHRHVGDVHRAHRRRRRRACSSGGGKRRGRARAAAAGDRISDERVDNCSRARPFARV